MEKVLNYSELAKYDIFKSMSENEIIKLLSAVNYQILKFRKDEVVFFRDEEINGLHLVLNGKLSAEMLNKNGDMHRIERFGKGDIIASAFIFGAVKKIPVDLVTLDETAILFVEREELIYSFQLNKKFLKNYLDEISNKAQFLSTKVWNNVNVRTIKEKLEEYIEQHKTDDIIIFNESIKELSERFMVSRPALSRVIGELVEDGRLERITRKKFRVNEN